MTTSEGQYQEGAADPAATNGNGHHMPPPPVRITMTPSVGKLLAALAAAQGEYLPIPKNRTVKVQMKNGGSYDFDYATLDAMIAATRPALSKHGLAFLQVVTGGGAEAWRITTILACAEERIEAWVQLPGDFDGPQELGSYITYLRRYTAAPLLGVVADEDDDGNAASGNQSERRERTAPPRDYVKDPPRAAAKNDNAERALRLTKILTGKAPDGLGWTKQGAIGWLKKRFGEESTSALTEQQLKDAELLSLAKMMGDKPYDEKVAELAAQGRCKADEAGAA